MILSIGVHSLEFRDNDSLLRYKSLFALLVPDLLLDKTVLVKL